MPEICLIHTSVDSQSAARDLARAMVRQSLCACVQLSGPGYSMFRWQGQLDELEEYYLSIKTTAAGKKRLIDWLMQYHPYDVPEICWVMCESTEAYAGWVEAEVRR